jgi:hypothetical protein
MLKHKSKTSCRLVLICALSFLASACSGPTYKYRYKLTLDLEVDGVQKSASSVVEIGKWQVLYFNFGYPGGNSLRGESLVIHIDNKQALALMVVAYDPMKEKLRKTWSHDPSYLLGRLYNVDVKDDWDKDGKNEFLSKLLKQKGQIAIGAKDLPLMIGFKDKEIYESGSDIDFDGIENYFEKNSIKFIHATIGITKDSITRGIEEKLPWIRTLEKEGKLDGKWWHFRW